MSAKKTGLGRSFDSLIPNELLDESFDPTAGEDTVVSDLRQIKLSEVFADPDQPRRRFDEIGLAELARSIEIHGILQPIVLTPRHEGGYTIVAGERRWRAARMAKLDRIPSLVRTLSDQHHLELSLIENLQRRDLNAIEMAMAYLKLRDQFNLTLDQIGERVGGKSQSTISNTLRLLRLPDTVKKAIADGSLTEGQARPLVGLDEKMISRMVPHIIAESWSARRIEQYIVQVKKGSTEQNDSSLRQTPYSDEVVRLKKHFGAAVSVKTNTRGAGQIVIKFKDADDFLRIEKMLER